MKKLGNVIAYILYGGLAVLHLRFSLSGVMISEDITNMGRLGGPVIDNPMLLVSKGFLFAVIITVLLASILLLALKFKRNILPLAIMNFISSGLILLLLLSAWGFLFADNWLAPLNGTLYFLLNLAFVIVSVYAIIKKREQHAKIVGNLRE